MAEQRDITCLDCYGLLREVSSGVKNLNKTLVKVIFALIAILAADKGIKLLGTPWYVHIGMWSCIFAGIWLLCMVIVQWKSLGLWRRVARVSISLAMLYASGLRIFYYGIGERIDPKWGAIANFLWVAIAISAVAATWTDNNWNGKERRDPNP